MSEDSSLPTHIGQTIVDGMMDIKHDIGVLSGKMDGMNTAVGELRGQVAQAVSRDECASLMAGKRSPRPVSSETAGNGGWKRAHTRLGVILALCALLGIIGGTIVVAGSAWSTLERAQAALQRLDGGK